MGRRRRQDARCDAAARATPQLSYFFKELSRQKKTKHARAIDREDGAREEKIIEMGRY